MNLFWLLSLLVAAPLMATAAPITVRVVDPNGAPVAGASVQVERFDQATPRFALALSDAQGQATYELDALTGNPNLFGRVAAWKAGSAVAGGVLRAGETTLILQPGASVRGRVETEAGPVEGALVQLASIRTTGQYIYVPDASPLAERLGARTDANGNFQIGGVPADSKVGLTVFDARYVTQRADVQAGGEVTIQTRPGATLRGRVTGVDGEPLAELEVSAQGQSRGGSQGYARAQTDANGAYELSGLSAGNYNILFDPAPGAPFVVAAIEREVASEGQTRELPDARAVEGVVVRGRVVDAATKAGVPDVSIGVYGPVRPASGAAVLSFATGENGEFAARVAPGSNRFYVMGAPPQWIAGQAHESDQRTLDVKAGPEIVGPTFEIKAASPITGRIVNEGGQGVAAKLVARQNWQEWPLESDENGDFTGYGPAEGAIEIGESRFTRDTPKWQVVSGQNATLPLAAPLRVVVKEVVLSKLTGRVTDETGAPLSGVAVEIHLSRGQDENEGVEFKTVTSDAQGQLELSNLRSDQMPIFQGATLKNYDRVGGGEVTRAGDGWVLSALTLRKRTGQIAGTVRRADGTPAAGAQVYAGQSETRADANGAFVLENLPAGALRVVAFAGDESAFEPANGAAKGAVNLQLAPQTLQPTDEELAGEFFSRARVLAATTNYYAKEQLKPGATADKARELEAQIQNPRFNELGRTLYLYASDRELPFELLRRAARAIDDAGWRTYMAGMLFAKRPDWPDDAATRAWVESLKADAKATADEPTKGQKWVRAIGLFGVAPILERFEGEAAGEAAGDAAFARARAFVEANFAAGREGNTPSRVETLVVMGEMLGATSPRLYARLLQDIPAAAEGYSRALQQGSVALARARGLQEATPFLRMLQNAPQPEAREDGGRVSVSYAIAEATRDAIAAGGAQAPALALELARAVPVGDGDDNRDRALAEAAFFQRPDVARAIWADVLPRLSAARAAQYAARIYKTDAELGRAQLEAARARLGQDDDEAWRENPVAAFAFYEAKLDPARAYYRLEKAWAEFKPSEYNAGEQSDLVRAMATLDGERAFEWATQIPNAGNARNAGIDALRRAAQWLEADAATRERVDFEKWGRGGRLLDEDGN